jgi:hypothetical protein
MLPVPLRKGMEFYRASNSQERNAVEGPVFRGGLEFYRASNSQERNVLFGQKQLDLEGNIEQTA